uniref:Ras-GEF domain-containing protein n=1 Tax=Arcella intermedia TaxID=1963864 RepID=A0A6B2L6J9_9EUKA
MMSPALATLEILSLKLIQRYYVPKELLKPAEQAVLHEILVVPIRLRVCILLKNIINAYWHLMSPSARRLLRAFVMVHEEAKQKNFLASQILKAMNKVIPVLPPRPVQPVVSTFKNMDFLSEFSPLDIAKTMTLIDWEVFKMIKPEEFLKQTWTKRPEKAPNLRAMIDRFNKITEWIVSHVVSGEKIKIRVKRYCKFVAIAEELKNFGSFHSFMAVLAALTQNPLTRLKFTLSEIPPRVKEQQKALEEIMSVENSYKNYRETLSSFLNNSKYPTIPYLGVFFRDIIYMDDGLKNDAGKYNTKYILSIYGIISQIQISQDHPGYPFEINEKLDKYLREMPNIFPTKILNDMVRQKEPKTATRADIE